MANDDQQGGKDAGLVHPTDASANRSSAVRALFSVLTTHLLQFVVDQVCHNFIANPTPQEVNLVAGTPALSALRPLAGGTSR